MATPAPIVEEAIGLLNEVAEAAQPEPHYPTGPAGSLPAGLYSNQGD